MVGRSFGQALGFCVIPLSYWKVSSKVVSSHSIYLFNYYSTKKRTTHAESESIWRKTAQYIDYLEVQDMSCIKNIIAENEFCNQQCFCLHLSSVKRAIYLVFTYSISASQLDLQPVVNIPQIYASSRVFDNT